MRIKDYADSLGVSSQSIYKRIRSPKYKERLKGHLYRDNQKVENLDLIGIKILEDYHFENDVIELEKTLGDIQEEFEQEKKGMQYRIDRLADKLTPLLEDNQNLVQKNYELLNYVRSLERQKLLLIIALAVMVITLLVAIVGQCEASDQGHLSSALLASASIIEAPLVAREVVRSRSCIRSEELSARPFGERTFT